ncbi:hypothetical protein A9Q87_10995 [Flavobacteriales bacterium 34_180_T64]|nr:hypothetical protein A9Q87_10995 [Flavobacteriales bacterium 34_180_T64]
MEEGNFNPTLKNHEDEDSKTAIIFNTVEACEYLNISKSTMYKLTSSKSISFYKPNGKNMYFKKDELDDFLLQSKQISNSELEAQSIDYIARKHNF